MQYYIKKYNIRHARVIWDIKPQRTYVTYEDDLRLYKHLNLNPTQKMQLIQTINDHRDKSYEVEGLVKIKPKPKAQSRNENDEIKKKNEVTEKNDDDENIEEGIDENIDKGIDENIDEGIDEDENEDGYDEENDHDKKNDDNEQKEQRETVKNPKEISAKNEEETLFQMSFMSRLKRVSPHLPSFNRNSSFWHLRSVGPDELFPKLNEMND